MDPTLPAVDPWRVVLVVVRLGAPRDSERRALARDVERGLLVRVRPGVYVRPQDWQALKAEGRHVLAMRALAAAGSRPPVFSHWSAAIAHGLPFMWPASRPVHTTVRERSDRGARGVLAHVLPLRPEDIVQVEGLAVTGMSRTVLDVAAASSLRDGVVVADGALAAGLPREWLDAAVDLAGPRRGLARAADTIAFAHPGGESANESVGRASMLVLGVEPPELQHEFRDREGLIGFADDWWRRQRIVGEADGARKYLGKDGGRALHEEKLREDRMRLQANGLVRWGWEESCSPPLLGARLARVGIVPLVARPTLADWARLARAARPRRPRPGFTPS